MTLEQLIERIKTHAEEIEFEQVIDVISEYYQYRAVAFKNGELQNEAGTNEGSCKIFAFAQLNELTEQQTLACFGKYYREDVLLHPEATDHSNIRNFMKTGWKGVEFFMPALTLN